MFHRHLLLLRSYNDDEDDGRTIVNTVVHQPGQLPVDVDYRTLLNQQGEWKVYDIVIGASAW